MKRLLVNLALIVFFWAVDVAALDDIVFIVNAKNSSNQISRSDIQEYYLKTKRSWPDGVSVRFLDRDADLGVRKIFLSQILKKTRDEIDLFWIGQKLYSGNAAPLQEASDTMAIKFVSAFPGAISYVSSSTPLTSKDVKPVKVQ